MGNNNIDDAAIKYDTSLSADIVIFTVHEDELKVLLVNRAHDPFKDHWALPGGFRKIGIDKSLIDIANRRLVEETGAKANYLEQLYTFGDEKRDPRGWVTSVAYFALMPYDKVDLIAGDGVSETKWKSVQNRVPRKLAFDHGDIIKMALSRIQAKLEYSPIAAHLLGNEFTLPDMMAVYELIMGCKLDKTFFRRSIKKADFLIDTGKKSDKGFKKAVLYKMKKGVEKSLFFPRGLYARN